MNAQVFIELVQTEISANSNEMHHVWRNYSQVRSV